MTEYRCKACDKPIDGDPAIHVLDYHVDVGEYIEAVDDDRSVQTGTDQSANTESRTVNEQ